MGKGQTISPNSNKGEPDTQSLSMTQKLCTYSSKKKKKIKNTTHTKKITTK